MNQINILEYLEETAPRLPQKIAFSTGKESRTFSEVYTGSRRIGSALAVRGYRSEPVAVLAEKHPDTVIAFFGVIYAGCYYACLDSSMPLPRMELILSSLSPRILLYDEKNRETALKLQEMQKEKGTGFPLTLLPIADAMGEPEEPVLLQKVRERQIDTDPIYVVFTSGSTGVPKGVIACHRSVIDYTENLSLALGFSESTVFANQTPLFFDAPLKELMPTIKFGATTYFVPKVCFSFPVKMLDFLDTYKINTVCWVVSAFTNISSVGMLAVRKPLGLKTVAFGSETFPRKQYDLWREALPDAKFFNLYGPTEATGMSCYWEARQLSEDEPIPIGRPFRNTAILLLDENGNEVRDGETGEICIRGTCLTMGYYREREKTAAVFTQNPQNDRYPETIYRTGDLAYRNPRGELVFRSRKDYQIKLMGRRIELGEIEAVASSLPGVGRVCCLFDAERQRILLFYAGTVSEETLRASLKDRLPSYMLPARIVSLSELPLTPNGKLDRKALLLLAPSL